MRRNGTSVTLVLAAATALVVAILGCQNEHRLPSEPNETTVHGELDWMAVRLKVDVTRGEVTVSAPGIASSGVSSSQSQGLGPGAAPSFALLGANEVGVATSNFVRTSVSTYTARVTFDVAVTNRLTSASLVPPTFPIGAAGATGLLLFPYRVTQVVGGAAASVIPSDDWNGDGTLGSGAPRNFFSDVPCLPLGWLSDCRRWEQFPSPLGAGESTAPQTVGFIIPKGVQSFEVLLVLAADISSDLPAVASLVVTPSSLTMANGFPATFTAVAYDARSNPLPWVTVKWLTADPTAAQFQYGSALVNNISGPSVVVHARRVAQTSITAKTGGVSVTVPLDIRVPTIALVQLYVSDANLLIGQQVQGDARVKDHSGGIVTGFLPTWSTSNPNVATVDANGLITAVAPGSATITATAAAASGSVQIIVSSGWVTKAPMLTTQSAAGAAVINGILYVLGGEDANTATIRTVEAYDPATNTWTPKAPMPTARAQFATAVVNGVLYAVGGQDVSGVLGTVEAYDPATDSWTTKASMPTPRRRLAAAELNGLLYAVGGDASSGTSHAPSVVEAYDPSTDRWATRADLPTPRAALAVVAAKGALYAIGGYDASGTVATVEVYGPRTDMWSAVSPMPTAREWLSAAVLNGVVYAMGGSQHVDPQGLLVLATVEAFDPIANSWSAKVPMQNPRFAFMAGAINGVLYVTGGGGPTEAYRP